VITKLSLVNLGNKWANIEHNMNYIKIFNNQERIHHPR